LPRRLALSVLCALAATDLTLSETILDFLCVGFLASTESRASGGHATWTTRCLKPSFVIAWEPPNTENGTECTLPKQCDLPLQVISLTTHGSSTQEIRTIRESVNRIQWALRELLPKI